MKKISLLLALTAVAGAASAQSVVYDTLTTATAGAYYTGTGNTLSGDNFNLPTLTSSQHYRVTGLDFLTNASAAGTYLVPLTISFYNTTNANTTTGAAFFSGLAGTYTTTLSGTATAAGSFLEFDPTTLAIDLASAPTNSASGYGVSFSFGANTAGTGTLSTSYVNTSTSITGSGSSTGMFIDTNGNGVLQNNEFYTLATGTYYNIGMAISAQVITQATPEPSAFAALGLGAVAMLRRRKRA